VQEKTLGISETGFIGEGGCSDAPKTSALRGTSGRGKFKIGGKKEYKEKAPRAGAGGEFEPKAKALAERVQ